MSQFKGKSVFVAGAGFFGGKAGGWFRGKGAKVMLVDVDSDRYLDSYNYLESPVDLNELQPGEIGFFVGDAVEAYIEFGRFDFDFVVPAVPGHFVGMAVRRFLEENGRDVSVPSEKELRWVLGGFPSGLTLTVDYDDGVLVSSYMQDGECMDDCHQPVDVCPETGREKRGEMYNLLIESVDKKTSYSEVIVSIGINGAGYLENKDIREVMDELLGLGSNKVFCVGTSCRCHGILNVMKVV